MGEPVMLQGLLAQARLNGTFGYAVGWEEVTKRYSIVIEKRSVALHARSCS
jgi:hypothetical protein